MIRSVVCPTSVGREAPLRSLLERLDRAVEGHGTVLLLGGDAGVGKSRLVRDLKQEATARHIRVVEGRCSSTESSVPYAPFMDALRFRIARGEGEEVAKILGPLRAILAPIFPQLEGAAAAPDQAVDRDRERPYALIFGVLERLATDDPMLLVLEDVHWADQTSLELLHHLAHRATSLRLMMVVTYRSDELHAAHPLRRLLGSLARDRAGEDMRLSPLGRDETTEMLRCMLGAEPDSTFAAEIWRRAEGNPLFVEELVSVLAEGGVLEPTADAAAALARTRLPSTVSEAILARVNALGPRAMETLSAAAVIGRIVEFEDLREVLGFSEEELVEVLEQLVAHQLLREERNESGESYVFPHALMQETLYESIISRRRRMLHRRVAAALEKRAARPSRRLDELAYHFRLGGDHEHAYEYARLAGDEAVRLRAWDDASEHYENALASLEEIGDEGVRAAEVLERLAAVAWRQSRGAAGRQYAEDALRLWRSLGQSEQTARVLRGLATLRVEEGDTEGAAEALDEALRLLGDESPSRELGPIYDDLGRLWLGRGDLDRAETLLLHGLSLSSRDAQGAEEVLALVGLAELSILGGEVNAGVARLDVALALLREGRLPFDRLARVYAEGVKALLLAQEYERALSWADAARALCRDQGVVGLDALFRAMRAAVLTITSGEEAIELGDRGWSVGLALVALAEGRNAEAAKVLEAALRSVPLSQPFLARQLLPYAAEALIAVGRVDDAAELVDNAPALSDAEVGAAQLAHAVGLVRLAQGRATEARDALSAAADAWENLGNRLECRRARVALLEAMLSTGDSLEGLALGRRLLEELGRPLLPREREVVRRVLRRAGVRTRPSVSAPGDARAAGSGLTGREQAVLNEVAKGRTNREIALALGIAEKTVSVHVSHILAKLGCKTRTQAARFVPQSAV